MPFVARGAGKVVSVFGKKAIQKAEQKALLEAGVPDARIAAKTLLESGKIAKDPIAQEVIR